MGWSRSVPPSRTAPYLAQHRTDPAGAARALTAEIQSRLRDLALHVPDAEWVTCVEQVADFASGWPQTTPDAATRLRLTRETSAALQAFEAADQEAAARFRSSADLLWVAADAWARHGRRRGRQSAWAPVRDAAALPVASLGYVYNMPPYLLLRLWIALFVRGREKRAFIKFLLGVPLFLGWYGLSARWLSRRRFLGGVGPLGGSGTMAGPVVGFLALRMRAHHQRWLDAWLPHNAAIDAARGEEIARERGELLGRLAPWLERGPEEVEVPAAFRTGA